MASSTSTEEGIDKVLSLLASRACGEATNDEVEAAIEEILGSRGSRPPAAAVQRDPASAATRSPMIEQDTEDYDNENIPLESVAEKVSPTLAEPVKKRGRGRPRKAPPPASVNAIVLERYDDIPLGRQGAKMMVAFGDGPQPIPSVVERALLACRRCLHAAIRDARHVRRRHQRWYNDAQRHLPQSTRHKARSMLLSKLPSDSQQFQFRALQPGSDSLSKNALCGFGTDELAILFPEEMCAYQRWSELHDATTQGTAEEGKENPSPEEDSTAPSAVRDESSSDAIELPGGHLQERLEQFDIRTDRMDKDNYLQFSTVRYQGSFLPRRSKGEEERRGSIGTGGAANPVAPPPRQGRPAGASTAQMSSVMVRFLHWLGFDIDGTVAAADDEEESSNHSALRLAAPSAETTHALAFLAHDFFGRIVEKAIFWRNVRSDETKVIIELGLGEQLRVSDIERALEDPEIRLEPLYASKAKSNSQTPKPQLYFGPGFEERLEMELEEMVESLTEEELKEREEEERFFAQLAATPRGDRFDSSGVTDPKATKDEGNGNQIGDPADSEQTKKTATSTRKRKVDEQ